jgi:LAO/AO transport system kinase
VQALKAGIMEIADVFVVNKADREGADRVVAEIESMLSLATRSGEPPPPIVRTVATADRGIDELWKAVEEFRARGASNGLLAERRRAQLRRQLEETVQGRLLARARQAALTPEELEKKVDRLEARAVDPVAAADEIIKRMGL